LIALEDAEGGQTRMVDSSAVRVKKRYERAAIERTQAFQRWCANSGIQAFTMATDVDPIVPLIELFSKRATRRGGR
jgi:hypothetical protein